MCILHVYAFMCEYVLYVLMFITYVCLYVWVFILYAPACGCILHCSYLTCVCTLVCEHMHIYLGQSQSCNYRVAAGTWTCGADVCVWGCVGMSLQ